jgi:hypothetical protein
VTRGRLLWAGQWTAALGFFFIAMVHLGIENRFRAVNAVEIGLSLLAILPAMTAVVPGLSTGALAALSLIGAAMSRPGTWDSALWVALTLLAAAVAVARFRIGYPPDGPSDCDISP